MNESPDRTGWSHALSTTRTLLTRLGHRSRCKACLRLESISFFLQDTKKGFLHRWGTHRAKLYTPDDQSQPWYWLRKALLTWMPSPAAFNVLPPSSSREGRHRGYSRTVLQTRSPTTVRAWNVSRPAPSSLRLSDCSFGPCIARVSSNPNSGPPETRFLYLRAEEKC